MSEMITADIKDKYLINATYNSRFISSPYSFNELNTMSYSVLNTKRYNNLLYAHTKSYINLELLFNIKM